VARFGGNEFTQFSVPLAFSNRYFILEPGKPPLITVLVEDEGRPAFEVLKNQPAETSRTVAAVNAAGIITVTDKANGKFLYKVRPGSETSVAFGTVTGGELSAQITDRSIRVGGLTLESNTFDGHMAGVLVDANGGIGVGAPIPAVVLKWLASR